jgi:ribosome assembly protein SQT1
MDNQNKNNIEINLDDDDNCEVDELSVEEIEEEDNNYDEEYLVDNDDFENHNDDTDMETIKEKDENEMEIEVENALPSIKGEFDNIKTDGEIYSIAMNDKGIIVLGDGEDTTYFIDANKKEIIKKEKFNNDSVTCIAFSSDGKFLVTGSLDGNAHIFETENFNLINTVNGSFAEINVNI